MEEQRALQQQVKLGSDRKQAIFSALWCAYIPTSW